MSQRIRTIGTAGHVDHGKSALVKALTGIDPDRLKEEKEREMTIDLGFAWLTLPSGALVSVVDVPGHESFIKNMLAGIGGIDAALFVVAADEGVMPQTLEHLDILDLLQLKHGLVAITKVDLVEDDEWLQLVTDDIAELLRATTLAEAEIVPVSAETGQGLPTLVEKLDKLLKRVPSKRDVGKPRLPIDRVFVMAGFGTVVTGTLIDGSLKVGQEVELLPSGLKTRIRGLQTHKQKLDATGPGGRVAVNLVGLSSDQLRRGDILTAPGWLKSSRLLDTRLRLLGRAPRPLKHNMEVEFYSGAAEIMARTRLLGDEAIDPGGEGWVQFRLAYPTAVARGDRFIIRQPSPGLTIGGGVVVDANPRRRHRRFGPSVMQRLEALSLGTPEEVLLHGLDGARPRRARELVRDSGLTENQAREALEVLVRESKVLVLGGAGVGAGEALGEDLYVISGSGWGELENRVDGFLSEYHIRYPLRRGMPREELKSRLSLPTRIFNAVVGHAVIQGSLGEEGGALKLPGHEVRFGPEQQRKTDELLARFDRSPYATPSVAECEASIGPELLSVLLEEGRLVRVSESVLFLSDTYDEMVARIVDHIKAEGSITVAQVRDMFQASRKYALALMEYLDEQRITKRVGDERVLR
ncbi:MAG: selenocysteine-specific translation elongation factor [Chloroflexi bacterium B3_Chlor]|nr:MAG: selenocysteine-specific translation elongation factor [Chloroflexi bacterium B3_Chlor]